MTFWQSISRSKENEHSVGRVEAFLTVSNVDAHIQERTVLTDISFASDHDRIGIVGRNGSGKSTLARVLAGLIKPTSGVVRINGTDVASDRKAALRLVGVLFQNPDHQIIFPTVREELAFGLRQQGQSKNEAVDNVDRTLLRFDKSHWRDASISTLSHGQKHLVCIMAITAMAPKLLILDEPFAGLDIPTIAQLKRHLTRFQGRVLHISHNPLDLEDASQLLWLEEGRICEVGSRCEVLPAYLSRMQDLGGRDDLAVLAS